MGKKHKLRLPRGSMNYLGNKPRIVNWKVIAGGELSAIQKYDVIFDDYDLKIRQIAVGG